MHSRGTLHGKSANGSINIRCASLIIHRCARSVDGNLIQVKSIRTNAGNARKGVLGHCYPSSLMISVILFVPLFITRHRTHKTHSVKSKK